MESKRNTKCTYSYLYYEQRGILNYAKRNYFIYIITNEMVVIFKMKTWLEYIKYNANNV